MHRIHLVDGGLGSVGKSVFCRVLIQYHIDRQRQYHFVEADQENPDVALCYPKRVEVDKNGDELVYVSRVIFADPAPSGFDPNPIFNWALVQPVIINLPFYAFKPVNHWLDSTGAIEMGQKHNVRFCKWFLTNGRRDSLKLFAESVGLFQGSIDHVLVCNHYFRKNWNHLEVECGDLLKRIPVISMTHLREEEMDFFNQHQLAFSNFCQLPLSVMAKQRVKSFLDHTYLAIDSFPFLL